jgi:hypothetical protein
MARRLTTIVALFIVSSTLWTVLRSAPAVPISPEAESHLTEIVAVLQREWLHRDKMDWDSFRRRVFERAGAAQTIPDTYDAIRLALTLLGDKHTYYRTAVGENMWNPESPTQVTGKCEPAPLVTPPLPADIGYAFRSHPRRRRQPFKMRCGRATAERPSGG